MSLVSKFQLIIKETLTQSYTLASDVEAKPQISKTIDLTDGTSDDQADLVYTKSGTLNAGQADSIDLAGSLTDDLGNSITFVTVKGIFLVNTSTLDAELELGGGSDGAGTNAFDTWITASSADGSEALRVPYGGFAGIGVPKTGFAVTAATGDILRVENTDGANAATYSLIIVGTSA